MQAFGIRKITDHEHEDKLIKRSLKFVRSQQALFEDVVSNNEGMVRANYAIAE